MDSTTVNVLTDPTMGANISTLGLAVATFLLTWFLSKTTTGFTLFKWVDPAYVATGIGVALSMALEGAFGGVSGGNVTAIGLVAMLIQRTIKWLPRVKDNLNNKP